MDICIGFIIQFSPKKIVTNLAMFVMSGFQLPFLVNFWHINGHKVKTISAIMLNISEQSPLMDIHCLRKLHKCSMFSFHEKIYKSLKTHGDGLL